MTITTNINTVAATVVVNNQTVLVPTTDYNTDLKPLIVAYNATPTDELMAQIMTKIDEINSVNRVDYLLQGEVKYYVNKHKFFFADDDNDVFEISEEVVVTLETLLEDEIDIKPLLNFFKLLRRSANYSVDFSALAMSVIESTFVDGKILTNKLDLGYHSEVAYSAADVNKFTLTDSGLIVAYKKAGFKDHKFDTKTGERICRFPNHYDEETREHIIEYPLTAEDYKIFLASKTIGRLDTRKEENAYVKVGQIVDQRKGKPGFEDDNQSLLFKGNNVKESDIYVKVFIHPQFINKFNPKFDSISSDVFMIDEFSFKPSSVKPKCDDFITFCDKEWKATLKTKKEVADTEIKAIKDTLVSNQAL